LKKPLRGSKVEPGDDRTGAIGGRQHRRLPSPRGQAKGSVLQLRLRKSELYRELSEDLGVGVERVAGRAPRLIGELGPLRSHALTLPLPGAGRLPRRISSMSDESIAARIDKLVTEEKELRGREQQDRDDDDSLEADRERLRAVEVELDQCWDLLRQRKAKEEFNQDPDDAEARSPGTVENYKQ